jgi:hypothetical protein
MKAPHCPMSPFLVFTEDSEGRVDKISIAGEKRVFLDADDVVSAVLSLMFMYVILSTRRNALIPFYFCNVPL